MSSPNATGMAPIEETQTKKAIHSHIDEACKMLFLIGSMYAVLLFFGVGVASQADLMAIPWLRYASFAVVLMVMFSIFSNILAYAPFFIEKAIWPFMFTILGLGVCVILGWVVIVIYILHFGADRTYAAHLSNSALGLLHVVINGSMPLFSA